MKILLNKWLLFILFMPITLIYGQDEELEKINNELQNNLLTVETAKESYEQKFEFIQTAVIRYGYSKIDLKGNKTDFAFEFNYSDLDPYLLREETKKDLIVVNLSVKNNQKLIKFYKNNEVDSYGSQISLITKNVDNARILIELIKKAIPLAEEITTNKLNLSDYDEMMDWLGDNIQDVSLNDKSYKQKIHKADHDGSLRLITTEISSKVSVEEQFVFNLADININSLKFNINKNKFGLTFEIKRKQKLVNYFKNGEKKPFVHKVEIIANNVEEARDIRTVLDLAIPLAQEKVGQAMKTLAEDGNNLEAAVALMENIEYGETLFEQSLESSCITNLKRVEQSAKSTKNNLYSFNLIDINPHILDFDISRDKMFVVLTTKENNKLIKYTKNSELDSYLNSVKIYTKNVEIARRLKYSLVKAIEKCESDFKDPYPESTSGIIKWLIDEINDVSESGETVKQVIELVDEGDLDKVKFTKIEIDEKKNSEEIYEFNFSDINPRSLNYKVRGKWLNVSIETNFGEKIIKYYKDGEIKPYLNALEFATNDIEKSRNIISALTKIIEDLSSE